MLFAIVAAIILIADQWLKYWVTVNITLSTGSVELIPGVIKLVNIHNSGAAFGFLDNVEYARWIFLAVTALFVVVIAVLLVRRVFDSRFAVWCEVLFLTGALGNCIDRVFLGYVVDMFKVEFVNFAVFNIADAVLVVSCLLFVIYVCFGSRPKHEVKKTRGEAKEPAPEHVRDAAPDDFADIFGFDTAEPVTPAEPVKLPPEQQQDSSESARPALDPFWDDFAPVQKAAASKDAPEPENPQKTHEPEDPEEEYRLEDILAEFKDF